MKSHNPQRWKPTTPKSLQQDFNPTTKGHLTIIGVTRDGQVQAKDLERLLGTEILSPMINRAGCPEKDQKIETMETEEENHLKDTRKTT